MANRSGSDSDVFLFGNGKKSSEFSYRSPPVRRIAGCRRAASASKRTHVASKPPVNSSPNVFDSGTIVELEVKITTEDLMAALVLSDDGSIGDPTEWPAPKGERAQTDICFPAYSVFGDRVQVRLDKSEVWSKVVDSEDRRSSRSSTPLMAQNGPKNISNSRTKALSSLNGSAKSDVARSPGVRASRRGDLGKGLNNPNPNMKRSPRPRPEDNPDEPSLPHSKYEASERRHVAELALSASSDSEVPEVFETNTRSFSPPVVYRRKTYYSDDELSWGDNSDIDDEGI